MTDKQTAMGPLLACLRKALGLSRLEMARIVFPNASTYATKVTKDLEKGLWGMTEAEFLWFCGVLVSYAAAKGPATP